MFIWRSWGLSMAKERTINGMRKPELLSLLKETINTVNEISQFYNDLIGSEGSVKEKVEDFDNYLFGSMGGEPSLKEKFKKQVRDLNDFYYEYFSDEEEEESRISEVKSEIESINDFYDDFFAEGEGGFSKIDDLEEKYQRILSLHDDLFDGSKGKSQEIKSMFNSLESDFNYFYGDTKRMATIKEDGKIINEFNDTLCREIKPEIETAREEINSLLSIGTSKSLLDGYLLSKKEYNNTPNYKKIKESKGAGRALRVLFNVLLFTRYVVANSIDYILFIFPLVIAVIIFTKPDLFHIFISSDLEKQDFSDLKLGSRIIISTPMWWISWFGQRNIMNKKRLAEEYNHKAQVVRMYLNFSSQDASSHYPILKSTMKQLEDELIKVISRNPAEVYKSEQSRLDKILAIFSKDKPLLSSQVNLGSAPRGGKVDE